MMHLLCCSAAVLAFFHVQPALSHPRSRGPTTGTAPPPVAVDSDFADPSLLLVDNTWYSFATSSGNKNVQVASSPDFSTWTLLDIDAMPAQPAWTAGPGNIWAPHPIQRADGSFVLYYAGQPQGSSQHCVGAAISDQIQGPYAPQPTMLACPSSQGGAIDASGYFDGTTHYVVYKVDGNSLGNNAPTPIILQPLEDDAMTPSGNSTTILQHSASDGPLVEAPSIGKQGSLYYLFFSSNMYNTPLYDISYATASNLQGPYTKATVPFQVTGDVAGIVAPGGATVSSNMTKMVYHAFKNGKDISDGRSMYAIDLTKYQLQT